jgi:hypothetical protein
MSAFFRFFASITKTISQALAPASVVLLILALYTGFVLPVDYMRGWISWIRWLNPIAYGFESTIINEFNGREFACSSFVPSGPSYVDILPNQRACTEKGAILGESFVRGANYIETAFSYSISNKWRNFGIIVAMTFALYALQLWMSEVVASERSKGEVLVFRRRKMPVDHASDTTIDEEKGNPHLTMSSESSEADASSMIQKSSSIFHWEDVCYQVKIKDETRVILDHVDGWIKPGTLTALMVSLELVPTKHNALTDVTIGCVRRWQDDLVRRAGKQDHGRGCQRKYACRRPGARQLISEEDRLRSTARPSPSD